MLQIRQDRSVIEQELDSLAAIARDAGIDPDALSDFLEGTISGGPIATP